MPWGHAAQKGEIAVADRPNILFFHVDNLGFGELSCYSGGPFRGTWTRRIDAFAGQGFRLTNYAPEAQCTPTRSALLTGRYSIRSGNHTVPLGAPGGWGLARSATTGPRPAGRPHPRIPDRRGSMTTEFLHPAGSWIAFRRYG